MKGKNTKKPAATKANAALSSEEGAGTVIANKKHHKKPKKQYQ